MEKGPLILSFRSGVSKSAWVLFAVLVVYVGALIFRLIDGRHLRWLDAAPALIPIVASGSTVFRRTVRIYQNGIWVPASEDKVPARFLTWSQIDRFQFEGDALFLAGTESMLKGGPVQSATILVPPGVQAQVMSVLAGSIR
jgi:hypothetical protein